jgi:hypothetical protein
LWLWWQSILMQHAVASSVLGQIKVLMTQPEGVTAKGG